MRTKNLIYGLFAALTVMGCSSEENITTDNGQNTGSEESHYLTVNILGGEGTTKSRADANYQYGTEAENKVNSVRFYFFKSNGDPALVKKSTSGGYVSYCDVKNPSTTAGTTENIEKVVNATVILNYKNDEEKPAKMVAVVNPIADTDASKNKLEKSLKLSELQAYVDDYSDAYTIDNTKYFLMTSSVYADNGSEIIAADLKDENLQQTTALAEANPVDIYVERVVAKVSFDLSNSSLSGKTTDSDGNIYVPALQKSSSTSGTSAIKTFGDEGKELYIKLVGWNVTATTDNSYLFKKIDPTWSTSVWGSSNSWTSPTYHRSYWAENPSSATIALPTIASKANTSSGGYTAFNTVTINKTANATSTSSIAGATAYGFNSTDVAYVQENAGTPSGTTALPHTKVIIAAQLCTKGNDNTYSPATIYEYTNNRYTAADSTACKQLMINAATPNVYVQDNTNGTVTVGDNKYKLVSPEDLWLVSAIKAGKVTVYDVVNDTQSYKSYLQLASGKTASSYYSISGSGSDKKATAYSSASDINNALLDNGVYANVYKDGYCYYYFDIQHLGYDVTNATFGKYGVVRNHLYACDLTAIYGIGTPVPDPEEIIVPEKPSEDVYVAAKINILSWRIVNNKITLEW